MSRKILLVLCLLTLFSCRLSEEQTLSRKRLFSLSYGALADKLNFFLDEHYYLETALDIAENNGFLYLLDGEAGKVLETNSYGDLIHLYYNPQKTDTPFYMSPVPDAAQAASRSALEWPFISPERIAVDAEGILYVSDKIPDGRRLTDEEQNVILSRTVYVFNKGRHLYTLGQEGRNGTPFPPIVDIRISRQNQPVVISRTEDLFLIFWFNNRGDLLYRVELDPNSLPPVLPANTYASIEEVFPDSDRPVLYTKMSYFREDFSSDTGMRTGIEFTGSSLVPLDLPSGEYLPPLAIPENRIQDEVPGQFETIESEYPYDFLGSASGNRLFFISPAEMDRKVLLIMDSMGKVLHKTRILLEEDSLYYTRLDIGPSGLLTGLLCGKENAGVVWWRSDLLTGSEE